MGRHQRRLGRRPRVTHSEVRALIVRDLRRHETPCNSRRRAKLTQAMHGPNFTRRRLKISLWQTTGHRNRTPSRLKITDGQIRRS